MVLNNDAVVQPVDLYMILLGEESIAKGLTISNKLRENNFLVTTETLRRSMKSQMREANRLNAKFVLIIGENEVKNNIVIIKNMISGEQIKIAIDDILNSSFLHK